jgi:predicted AAA+ superfamily ATPase
MDSLSQPWKDFLTDSVRPPHGPATPRTIRGPLLLPGKATAVIGMRRAGKTTFLHQQRRERLAAGIAPQRLPYWNFEDERTRGMTAEHLTPLLDEFHRQHPHVAGTAPLTLCLDELQLVPGWERFVRRLLDTESIEIFLSGSSAAMLSREVATAMRGRGWEVIVHPFAFGEALRHRNHELPERPPTGRQRTVFEGILREYLAVGGFPEVQMLDAATRHRVLQDYVDVVMLRDVIERHEITGVTSLRWLVRHLLGNAGGAFSVQKFFDALKSQGLRVGKDTLHDLLAHLTDCFLVRTVWLETDSERRRMVNPRKIYPVDPGLIPVFDRSGKANLGHALETAVLIELERRGAAVTFVRTTDGHEVDFLARFPGDDTPQLLQVAADAATPATADRELRALRAAGNEFPRATQHLIVLDHSAGPPEAPRGVRVHSAANWLLGLS